MGFQIIHFAYFLVYVPILAIAIAVMLHLKKRKLWTVEVRFAIIAVLLFLGRMLLLPFGLGQFPNIAFDPLFYALLLIIGLGLMMFYVREIENYRIRELGKWKEQLAKQIVVGILGAVSLLLFSVLMLFIAVNYRLTTPEITVDKFFTALFFGLGAIYEEWFFRGVMLKYRQWWALKQIVISSIVFFVIHIGYLPFTGYGVYYFIMLVFSFSLAFNAKYVGILSSTLIHFIFVFVSVITI